MDKLMAMTTKTEPPRSFELDSLAWWKRSGIWIVLVLLAAFGFLSRPMRPHGGKNPTQTEAVTNARQIGLALFEFQREYGSMPDTGTIEKVRQKTGTDLKLGTKSSNDFFRQLLAANITGSELIFYAKVSGTSKPDSVFIGAKALEKGECGFTYLTGVFDGCDPGRPVIVAPMIPGTDRFDPKPFAGKAVVLRADNSVTSLTIDNHGHAIFEGENLMDPAHPVWQGKPPVIAWPDL
jgi:hypothetical protein